MPSLDWKTIMRELRIQDWTLEKLNGSHWKATPPDKSKSVVHFATSGSDPRAIKNSLAQLRTSGFVWDEQPTARRNRPITVDSLDRGANLIHALADQGYKAYDPEPSLHGPLMPPALVAFEVVEEIVVDRLEVLPDPAQVQMEMDMDQIYNELKEAKTYLSLAADARSECESALQRASEALKMALAEEAEAKERLKNWKTRFDAAFAAEGSAA